MTKVSLLCNIDLSNNYSDFEFSYHITYFPCPIPPPNPNHTTHTTTPLTNPTPYCCPLGGSCFLIPTASPPAFVVSFTIPPAAITRQPHPIHPRLNFANIPFVVSPSPPVTPVTVSPTPLPSPETVLPSKFVAPPTPLPTVSVAEPSVLPWRKKLVGSWWEG